MTTQRQVVDLYIAAEARANRTGKAVIFTTEDKIVLLEKMEAIGMKPKQLAKQVIARYGLTTVEAHGHAMYTRTYTRINQFAHQREKGFLKTKKDVSMVTLQTKLEQLKARRERAAEALKQLDEDVKVVENCLRVLSK